MKFNSFPFKIIESNKLANNEGINAFVTEQNIRCDRQNIMTSHFSHNHNHNIHSHNNNAFDFHP